MTLPLRARAAVATTRLVNGVSRRLGAGTGTVIGGRAGLAVDPGLLGRLAAGRQVALVSGTNGKTTTTRLLAVALEDPGRRVIDGDGGAPRIGGACHPQTARRVPRRGGQHDVVTNATGANMPAGHVAALAVGPPATPAVLEVDEGYLPGLVASLRPDVVLLLNLSRDQLDRTSEVRMLAGRWREALAGAAGTTVVANADDPLVAWGAGTAPRVVWVGAGLGWRLDAVGCPACEGRITFGSTATWSCTCGFARPAPDVRVEDGPGGGTEAVWAGGRRLPVVLGIPGRFNRTNAVMAAAAAEALGVPAERALSAMATVGEVAGRFTTRRIGGVPTRLMLAKNPAGWHELLGLVCPGPGPVVVGINARVADGRDPSWLWDVPFERLRGRPVVATGERCLDLSVRLRYAEVPHRTVRDPVAAVGAAAGRADGAAGDGTGRAAGDRAGGADGYGSDGATWDGARVEFIGNYTAFSDLLARQ